MNSTFTKLCEGTIYQLGFKQNYQWVLWLNVCIKLTVWWQMISAAVSSISTWMVIGCKDDEGDESDLKSDFQWSSYLPFSLCSLITDIPSMSLSLSFGLSPHFAVVHFWHFAARFINHRSCRCGLMWHWKRPRVAFHNQISPQRRSFQCNQCNDTFSPDEDLKKHKHIDLEHVLSHWNGRYHQILFASQVRHLSQMLEWDKNYLGLESSCSGTVS